MDVIPTMLVALSSLFAIVAVLCGDGISIKIYSVMLFSQFALYVYFTFSDAPIEARQYMARSNIIFSNLALIIIILASRWRKRNG